MAVAEYYTLHRVSGFEVPSYFFTAPDASAHIFDFLSDPKIGAFVPGEPSLFSWSTICSVTAYRFIGYSPFLGCLLYTNVTRNLLDGTLPSNLTDLGFPRSNDTDLFQSLRSTYTTCLVTYCASQSDCASRDVCNVGNLLTPGYELSAQGVSECFQHLCSLNVQVINPDIAGIGILLSYLIQSVISFAGLFVLAGLALLVHWHSRKAVFSETAASDGERAGVQHHKRRLDRVRHHWAVVNLSLAEFHKNQCYFAIALQIASFVVIFSNLESTTDLDRNFLLLVTVDGLAPVVLTLYTLMVFGKKSWYMTILSVISVILSSVTGSYLIKSILLDGDEINPIGGPWPDACGNVGPHITCALMGPNQSTDTFNDRTLVLAVIIIMDVMTAFLVLWQIFCRRKLGLATRRQLVGWFTDGSISHNDRLQYAQRLLKSSFHVLISSGLLACLAIQFYFFAEVFLHSPYVDFTAWGFGQVVGLTTWFGTLVELAYLEYFGVEAGSDWRWPKWLHVVGAPSTTTPQPGALDDSSNESSKAYPAMGIFASDTLVETSPVWTTKA